MSLEVGGDTTAGFRLASHQQGREQGQGAKHSSVLLDTVRSAGFDIPPGLAKDSAPRPPSPTSSCSLTAQMDGSWVRDPGTHDPTTVGWWKGFWPVEIQEAACALKS